MTTHEKTRQIARSLDDKAYSEAFVEAEIATTIPFQIRALRQERKWTQKELADKTEQHQKTISDFENPDMGPGSIASLRRIAAAFDVGLIVRFAPFSELVDWSVNMTRTSHFVRSRTKDTKLRFQRNGTYATTEDSTSSQMRLDWNIQNVVQMSGWKASTCLPGRLTNSNTLEDTPVVNRAQAAN